MRRDRQRDAGVDAGASSTDVLDFVLPPNKARELAASRGLASVEALARQLCGEVSPAAWPPTSKFYVGCVAIGATGALYLGVNLEFPPLPINGDTVHGEQFAVA
eukprot:SAG22_NODE_9742_length_572_cov_1.019027_1_plen_103_part_01